ncbi:Nck-associated protein 5-like [Trichinella nelsoni]|uniref:Nck-associated protein 5-like n=1 Tax=Trichinella nelsoni TaxID=6336 RepID=A0A0V0RLH0_9BILA|nr:Nck-associated protein 5-like [Trichinella nelsoni]
MDDCWSDVASDMYRLNRNGNAGKSATSGFGKFEKEFNKRRPTEAATPANPDNMPTTTGADLHHHHHHHNHNHHHQPHRSLLKMKQKSTQKKASHPAALDFTWQKYAAHCETNDQSALNNSSKHMTSTSSPNRLNKSSYQRRSTLSMSKSSLASPTGHNYCEKLIIQSLRSELSAERTVRLDAERRLKQLENEYQALNAQLAIVEKQLSDVNKKLISQGENLKQKSLSCVELTCKTKELEELIEATKVQLNQSNQERDRLLESRAAEKAAYDKCLDDILSRVAKAVVEYEMLSQECFRLKNRNIQLEMDNKILYAQLRKYTGMQRPVVRPGPLEPISAEAEEDEDEVVFRSGPNHSYAKVNVAELPSPDSNAGEALCSRPVSFIFDGQGEALSPVSCGEKSTEKQSSVETLVDEDNSRVRSASELLSSAAASFYELASPQKRLYESNPRTTTLTTTAHSSSSTTSSSSSSGGGGGGGGSNSNTSNSGGAPLRTATSTSQATRACKIDQLQQQSSSSTTRTDRGLSTVGPDNLSTVGGHPFSANEKESTSRLVGIELPDGSNKLELIVNMLHRVNFYSSAAVGQALPAAVAAASRFRAKKPYGLDDGYSTMSSDRWTDSLAMWSPASRSKATTITTTADSSVHSGSPLSFSSAGAGAGARRPELERRSVARVDATAGRASSASSFASSSSAWSARWTVFDGCVPGMLRRCWSDSQLRARPAAPAPTLALTMDASPDPASSADAHDDDDSLAVLQAPVDCVEALFNVPFEDVDCLIQSLNDSAASNDDQLCLSTRKKRTEDDAATVACQGSELLSCFSQAEDTRRLLPEMNHHDVALDAAEELEDTDLSTDVSVRSGDFAFRPSSTSSSFSSDESDREMNVMVDWIKQLKIKTGKYSTRLSYFVVIKTRRVWGGTVLEEKKFSIPFFCIWSGHRKFGLVRYLPPEFRPSILRRDVYCRFGKQEREALSKFDFLAEFRDRSFSPKCKKVDSTRAGALVRGREPGDGKKKRQKAAATPNSGRPDRRSFSFDDLASAAVADGHQAKLRTGMAPAVVDPPEATWRHLSGSTASVHTSPSYCSSSFLSELLGEQTFFSSSSSLSFSIA